MIYFGNEFNLFGNDRSVAEMEDENRPGFIVNVGRSLEESERLPEIVIEDGNGPRGTLNYLKFLLHAGRYFSEDVVNILAEGNQPANPNKIDLAELLTKIDECFNLADFKTLCFALEIDYDNLSGETKVEKSRELISYSISHSIFNVLISELQKRRPMVNWKPELE
jgi:hypothetical protein